MTDEEKALKEIDLLEERGEFSSNIAKTIREALNYRIAKKPKDFSDDFGEAYLCPTCGRNNFYTHDNQIHRERFCDWCGQKIDWGDGEEKKNKCLEKK